MTLNEIIDQVSAIAVIDRQSQSNITLLRQWVDLSIKDISTRYPWPWLHSRVAISTVADTSVTDDSITATNGSKTVTSTTANTFAATDVNRFIQFSSSNDWYEITARASGTSITIEPAYAGTTATDLDATIRTFSYNLPSDCHKVFDVRTARTPAKLHYIDTRMFDLFRPNQTGTGTPRAYYLYYYRNPQSATGQQWAISFDPIPSAAMLIEIRYLKKPASLSAGTDIAEMPEIYHNVIIDGATYLAMKWSNNPSTGGMKQQYESGLRSMILDMPQTEDQHNVLQAVDEQSRRPIWIPYPQTFDENVSF